MVPEGRSVGNAVVFVGDAVGEPLGLFVTFIKTVGDEVGTVLAVTSSSTRQASPNPSDAVVVLFPSNIRLLQVVPWGQHVPSWQQT